MRLNLRLELRRLIREAEFAIDHLDSTLLFEPWLVRVVQFVRAHPEARREFAEEFVASVRDDQRAYEVLEFCMAALRWPEVLAAVREELARAGDPRRVAPLADIESAFSDTWEDKDLYETFSATNGTMEDAGSEAPLKPMENDLPPELIEAHPELESVGQALDQLGRGQPVTATCRECGAVLQAESVEATGALVIQCPAGHTRFRARRAPRNS